MPFYPKGSDMSYVDDVLSEVKRQENVEQFYQRIRNRIQQEKITTLLAKMDAYARAASSLLKVNHDGTVDGHRDFASTPWTQMWDAYNEVIRAK